MKKVQDKNHVDEKTFLLYYLFCKQNALVAESVDASDLKSDWANNSVPVQVWSRAIFQALFRESFLFFSGEIAGKMTTLYIYGYNFYAILA